MVGHWFSRRRVGHIQTLSERRPEIGLVFLVPILATPGGRRRAGMVAGLHVFGELSRRDPERSRRDFPARARCHPRHLREPG